MISLFVDTSYKSMYVALIKDKQLMDYTNLMAEANFSELLLPSINSLLKKNNVDVNDIDKIYATVGPGSFTGMRIGLTVCKMLAWSLGKGIIPISSLEFMATTNVKTKYVIPFIDARHDKVFGGVYDTNLNIVIADAYTSINDLKDKLDDSYTFVSYDNFDLFNLIKPEYDVMRIINKHQNDNEISCHAIKPNYLKRTEAEESRL